MEKVKTVIGRIEKVNFPSLDLFGIDAKIDTGAHTSAIHCHDIREDAAQKKLYFKLLDPSHSEYSTKEIVFDLYTKTVVKSSMGITESRYKIKTQIQIGTKLYKTSFTLSDRENMKYPILLGRVVLNKRFIVDTSKKYQLTLPKN